MAEVNPRRPADNVGLSAGHAPRCQEYRRAYRERNGSLSALVCCCAELPETQPSLAESRRNLMGDMPCVWCLLWLNTAPEQRPVELHAYPYGALAEQYPEPVPVRGWAHAEELTTCHQFRVRDSLGTYFGMDAATLVAGDALCLSHAMHAMSARAR